MPITALQLQAKVTADTKDAEAGLNRVGKAADDASGSHSGFGVKGLLTSMLSIAGGIGIAAGVGDAFDFLKGQLLGSVDAAKQYQLVQAQTNAVLASTHDASGQTAESIAALAEHLQTLTPYSRDATQSAENMLLTFTNIKGNLPEVTGLTLDFATAMHMDATTAALQLGKALNDPATGYSKLQREGVTFTQEQIKQIKAMEASGNTAGAQAIILKELQKEFGGSAQAAGGTFAGALQIAQNELHDTTEQVGTKLLPVLATLIKDVAPLVTLLASGLATVLPIVSQAFGDLITAAQPLIDALPGLVGSLGSDLPGALSSVTPLLSQLGQIFTSDVIPIAKQFGQILQTDVIPIARTLGQLFLSNLIPVIRQLAEFTNQHLMPAFKMVADFVKTTVVPIIKTLVTVFVNDILPAAESVGATITDKLLPPLKHILEKIMPVLNPMLQFMGTVIKDVIGPAVSGLINGLAGLATGISKVIDWLGQFFGWIGNVASSVGGFLGDLGHLADKLNNDVTSAINGVGSVFGAVFGGLWDVVKAPLNLIIGGINDLIDGLNHIHFSIPGWVPGVGGKSFGIHIDKIPLLAEGGVVDAAGSAIVGERGAELVTLPRGAQVTPLGAGGALGGAGLGGGLASLFGGGAFLVQVNSTVTMDGMKVAQIVTRHQPQIIRNATGARGF